MRAERATKTLCAAILLFWVILQGQRHAGCGLRGGG